MRERERDLGDEFADGNVVEIGGVAGVPLAEAVFELELHEVAGDGGDEHVAGLSVNRVIELENPVVARAAVPGSQALIPGENAGHRLGHRRLLRHVQYVDGAPACHSKPRRKADRWTRALEEQ